MYTEHNSGQWSRWTRIYSKPVLALPSYNLSKSTTGTAPCNCTKLSKVTVPRQFVDTRCPHTNKKQKKKGNAATVKLCFQKESETERARNFFRLQSPQTRQGQRQSCGVQSSTDKRDFTRLDTTERAKLKGKVETKKNIYC